MKKFLFASFALGALTGCVNETLTVHTDYISHENLASSYVGTPDPLLETALVGQRLIISWWIPRRYQDCANLEIHYRLRYGNREEAQAVIRIAKRVGWYSYALTNEEFFEKKGIKTYQVQLYANGEIIDEWQHQLWTKLIQFTPESSIENADFLEEDDTE